MCLKGKKTVKDDKAKFVCKKCGATAAKKDDMCKPEKVKK